MTVPSTPPPHHLCQAAVCRQKLCINCGMLCVCQLCFFMWGLRCFLFCSSFRDLSWDVFESEGAIFPSLGAPLGKWHHLLPSQKPWSHSSPQTHCVFWLEVSTGVPCPPPQGHWSGSALPRSCWQPPTCLVPRVPPPPTVPCSLYHLPPPRPLPLHCPKSRNFYLAEASQD